MSSNCSSPSSSIMGGDSGSARMLERRVSNNRGHLNSDQQMNYFLSWFNQWSELQRTDFVPILGQKMLSPDQAQNEVNGALSNSMQSASLSKRPPSLFECQA